MGNGELTKAEGSSGMVILSTALPSKTGIPELRRCWSLFRSHSPWIFSLCWLIGFSLPFLCISALHVTRKESEDHWDREVFRHRDADAGAARGCWEPVEGAAGGAG